jgi:hypothetical protein
MASFHLSAGINSAMTLPFADYSDPDFAEQELPQMPPILAEFRFDQADPKCRDDYAGCNDRISVAATSTRCSRSPAWAASLVDSIGHAAGQPHFGK